MIKDQSQKAVMSIPFDIYFKLKSSGQIDNLGHFVSDPKNARFEKSEGTV